jgi:mRNA interferase MazF
VVIAQGEVWWAGLGEPAGSEPGFRRPVVVVQSDAFNASSLRTVLCVVLTSNVKWGEAPGNVLRSARATGLPKPSVANVSQLVTIDRTALTERAGRLSANLGRCACRPCSPVPADAARAGRPRAPHDGRTNREIATDLFISEKTASVHVSNIKSKMGANGRAEIAAIAVRLRLVPEITGGYELEGSVASAPPLPAGRSAPRP